MAIPDLIALGIPDMVTPAGYPSTPKIPALSYVLSLLALKLTSTRRVSHVYDIAADPGAALFAGLTALPKATALTSYSYRLEHSRQAAFLAALDKASLAAGLADGEALNLDFHAVMHWGQDPVLEKHYVPRRSQRTRSVLTFFAEDAATHTLLYANADLSKASQNREVIAFADHWNNLTGSDPALLIFDSNPAEPGAPYATSCPDGVAQARRQHGALTHLAERNARNDRELRGPRSGGNRPSSHLPASSRRSCVAATSPSIRWRRVPPPLRRSSTAPRLTNNISWRLCHRSA